MKILIKINAPILTGSISTASSRCGKTRCACKDKEPKLHGPYYRWTGVINGKRTTKTISKEVAHECQKRIDQYKKFKKQIDEIMKNALLHAPWKADLHKMK